MEGFISPPVSTIIQLFTSSRYVYRQGSKLLGRRLLSAAVIIGVLLVLIWFDYQMGTDNWASRPGLILGMLSVFVAALAAGELVELLQAQDNRLSTPLAVAGAMVMVAIDCARFAWADYPANCPVGTLGWSMAGLTAAIVLTFLAEMRTYGTEQPGKCLNRLGRYGFIFVYLQILFAFMIGHRVLGSSNGDGLFFLILLIATVKMSDAAAYFVGKSIGRHPIAPVLSPKKTLEGSIGGILGGIAGATIMFYVIGPQVFGLDNVRTVVFLVMYGTLVTLAGMVGDLAESLLKREAQIKDSSSWLPGLGGILDIADSLVFAAPVSFFLLVS